MDFLVSGLTALASMAPRQTYVLGGRVYGSSSAADREEQLLSRHRLQWQSCASGWRQVDQARRDVEIPVRIGWTDGFGDREDGGRRSASGMANIREQLEYLGAKWPRGPRVSPR